MMEAGGFDDDDDPFKSPFVALPAEVPQQPAPAAAVPEPATAAAHVPTPAVHQRAVAPAAGTPTAAAPLPPADAAQGFYPPDAEPAVDSPQAQVFFRQATPNLGPVVQPPLQPPPQQQYQPARQLPVQPPAAPADAMARTTPLPSHVSEPPTAATPSPGRGEFAVASPLSTGSAPGALYHGRAASVGPPAAPASYVGGTMQQQSRSAAVAAAVPAPAAPAPAAAAPAQQQQPRRPQQLQHDPFANLLAGMTLHSAPVTPAGGYAEAVPSFAAPAGTAAAQRQVAGAQQQQMPRYSGPAAIATQVPGGAAAPTPAVPPHAEQAPQQQQPAAAQTQGQWGTPVRQADPFAVPAGGGAQAGGLDEGLDSLLDFLGGGRVARPGAANGGGAARQPQAHQQQAGLPQASAVSASSSIGGPSASSFDMFGLPMGSGTGRAPLFNDEELAPPPPQQEEEPQGPVDPLGGADVVAGRATGPGAPSRPPRADAVARSTSALATSGAGAAAAGKPKARGSIDLDEARRRTALLMGEGAYSRRSSSGSVSGPSGGNVAATPGAMEQAPIRQEPTPIPARPVDPLGTGGGGADAGGSYFNEDLLRQRQARTAAYGGTNYGYDTAEADASSTWDTGAILGRAGNMVSAAKSGAKSLLQRANGYGAAGGGAASAPGTYEVTFGEGRLGFMLVQLADGRGAVSNLQPGSSAANMGVCNGDIPVAINRRSMWSYESIMSYLPTAPRPVLVTFAKPTAAGTPGNGQAGAAGAAPYGTSYDAESASGNKNWLGNLDPFKSGKRRSSAGDAGAGWRVDNQDLQVRRPDFHGVVVRAFGGVFSWSLYGTSDGSEAPGQRLTTGDTYTEYVMQCQWGPDLQSMLPWVVGRRYREFDALDKDLRQVFPHLKDSFPQLPPKELFKTSQEVVARRRVGLEQYMTFLIGNCPDVLCCSHMDRFLMIAERIATIKAQNKIRRAVAAASGGTAAPNGGGATAADGGLPPLTHAANAGAALVGTDFLLNLMTAGEAYDLMRARSGSLRPLGRQGVAQVEAAVRRLDACVKDWSIGVAGGTTPMADPELHGLADICQQAWPMVKATAARSDDTPEALELLPRVLQCDEDIERVLLALTHLCRGSSYGAPPPIPPASHRMGMGPPKSSIL